MGLTYLHGTDSLPHSIHLSDLNALLLLLQLLLLEDHLLLLLLLFTLHAGVLLLNGLTLDVLLRQTRLRLQLSAILVNQGHLKPR